MFQFVSYGVMRLPSPNSLNTTKHIRALGYERSPFWQVGTNYCSNFSLLISSAYVLGMRREHQLPWRRYCVPCEPKMIFVLLYNPRKECMYDSTSWLLVYLVLLFYKNGSAKVLMQAKLGQNILSWSYLQLLQHVAKWSAECLMHQCVHPTCIPHHQVLISAVPGCRYLSVVHSCRILPM